MNDFFKKRRFEVRFTKDIEPHEVILDNLAKKKGEEIGVSERKIEVPLLKTIFNRSFLFSVLVILVLFWRVFQLQIVEGEDFLAKANENRYILSKIQAERGVIYDRNLKQLVFNISSFNLICEKDNLPQSEIEKQRILKEVSQILNINYETLQEKIRENKVVFENLDHQTLIVLETKIGELPGFKIEQNSIRDYKEGDNFSHLIGYVGKISSEEWKKEPEYYSISDYVGITGIEKYHEEVLRKNPGKVKIERDALENVISKEIVALPESGESLVLWLDSDLQRKTKEELEKQLQSIGSRKAVAVALDPKTGGVLALVSIPSFDNNLFSKKDKKALEELFKDENEPLFNRVISGIGYSTGSTIKPLIASAALQENVISSQKSINCRGLIEVEHEYNPEIIYTYHDWQVHGWTDMRKAIAESCNVYFYSIGGGNKDFEIKGLGPQTIKEYLQVFGWGKKTGIDLPSEGKGILPDIDEDWRLGHTYYLSIGQGAFTTTPLQVINAFAAIANGGKLMQPQVVQKIVGTEQGSLEVLREIEPKIIRENFIDSENLQIAREGMRQAVTGKNSPLASATLLNSLPVAVAAKTGTAETPIEGIYHNWVTVFAPYEDPEIVLTIMIEDVKDIKAAVLPVAKEILNWYFAR
ncbi:MAG: hypothetical protein IB617_01975 [Candidatus Nealsonbacteria bacterium]|nr:MAG: hypothetical protein IB617_01975 [Candidatus Nealsonbacteria bacterium]